MATGIRAYLDNFSTTVNETLTDSDTTITVTDATGLSAALSGADYIALTIDDGTNIEIVHCTNVSSNDLTVERGQEGTTGTSFASGTDIEVRATADSFNIANLTGVDFSGGAPSTDDQLKFDASGNLIPFTPSGGSEFSLVSTQTLGSAVSNVVFDISSAGVYKIVMSQCTCSADADLLLTVAYDSGGTTYAASNYKYACRVSGSISTSMSIDRSQSNANIRLVQQIDSSTARPFYGEVLLQEKTASTVFSCDWDISASETSFGHDRKLTGNGFWLDTTNTLVEVKLAMSTGNFSIGSVFHLLKRNY